MTKKVMAVLAVLGLAATMAGSVRAQNFVTNGSFEVVTAGGGQMGFNTNATDWTTDGYNFIFTAGSADTTGVTGQYGGLELWGPNNGSANGLPATSPDGGNYVGADGDFQTEPITQTITGLTPGDTYALNFFWGAAQQSGFYGATTDLWIVSLGSQTYYTPVDSIPSQGFSGWQSQTFDYTATSPTEVLSFLANGTPSGVPPFAVLDGVSLYATPEPSPLVVMFVGLLGLGAIVIRRVRVSKSAV